MARKDRPFIVGVTSLVLSALAVAVVFALSLGQRPPFERMLDSTVKIESDGAICSGVVILSDGLILTNAHCMAADAATVKVTLRDGRTFNGLMLLHDAKADLAVVSINLRARSLAPAMYRRGPLAYTPLHCRAAPLRAGDEVYAIGHPSGVLTWTVTRGIVSAMREGRWAQVDALIWYGNSGGPLFDAAGGLAGLNNALWLHGGQATGHGFSLTLSHICDALKRGGLDLA